MAKQPTLHLFRQPLPWRASRLTECGLLVEKVLAQAREEVVVLSEERKETICDTCWERCRYKLAETSLEREVAWSRRSRKKDHFIDFELQAIGLLVARYQDEFDRIVAALQAEQVILKGRD